MESINDIVLQTEDFELVTQEQKDAEKIVRPSLNNLLAGCLEED